MIFITVMVNVFIDTVSPRIQLVGHAEYFIVNGTVDPIIPGVNVTDGDPKYSGNFTLVTNATVDATINGSVYNYTYTAVADTAGNLGASVSRIITIIDAEPITVTSLSIASSSGNNFANAGKTITLTLVTDGTDLGNFTGTLIGRDIVKENVNSGTATFTTTVFSNDTNGNVIFSITVTNSSGNKILVTNYDITDVSFVTIDTVKPVIALVGASTVTVLQGNSYSDLGTTITDQNNPSYAGTISATSIGTSSLGSKTITYSAPADAAGNVPDSITRTVTVQAKPLGLETLTIESNNAQNNSYAKTDDKITITLVANGTIGSATTINIASNTITPVLTGSTLVASYIVDSSVSDTNSLAFTINASNEDGLKTVIFTEANLLGSSIIIDNTAPTITLVGNNNTVVPTNSSYTDPGAIASDLSYAGDIAVTGTSNFDITKSGNYTFTYTAEDEAGNTGPSITRNIIVRDTPPIGIANLTIVTDDDTYAKAGDNLHLTLNVNDTISTYDAQILNADIARYSPGTTSLYMLATVSSNTITESNAEFTITVTNPNGTTLTVTEDDLTSPNVFIDTVSPRIQLVGSAEYFIVNGTVDPIIPGVNVTDGDPNYSGNFTLATNATADATINGSVYNYTYTADADNAGNLGESVSRIITIIDAEPITVTSLNIASSSSNNLQTKTQVNARLFVSET